MSQTFAFSTNAAIAQITPDATLPNNSSVKLEGNTFNITGGTQAGSNLFHSFGQFSVPTGGTAFFNNALDIQNIISRVTGGSVSNIDGLIRTQGNANLFLINPNGIIFGKNASLNIGGSFVATTANAIQFGNQGFFSASNPNTPALLTVNPNAFLFNQIEKAPIQNNSVAPAGVTPSGFNTYGLRVADGRSLLLVGGNVSMDGGRIRAYGGRVELGGLATPGTVGLLLEGNNLSLSFPDNVTKADVSLTNEASVRVDAAGGGSIAVNARNLDILGGSFLGAGIGLGLESGAAVAGDITLNATGETRIVGSDVFNDVQSQAVGNGGNITISSGSLSLTDGAVLSASTYGQGNSGNIFLQADNSVSLTRNAAIINGVQSQAVGNGGNITISSGSLSLTDDAVLFAGTYGQGNSGNIFLQADNSVSLTRNAVIFNQVQPGGVGNGGNITISSGSLSLSDDAQLGAGTYGQGNSGNIFLQADNSVSLTRNAAILNQVQPGGVGNGGDINITAGSLSLTDGVQLLTYTNYDRDRIIPDGRGDAGNVNINARDTVTLVGKGKDSGTYITAIWTGGTRSEGHGGDININARSLSLTNAQLGADTSGKWDAGNIVIRVIDSIYLTNSDFVLEANRRSRIGSAVTKVSLANGTIIGNSGNGGNIDIQSRSLSLDNGAVLDASTQGSGNAGNIRVSTNTFAATNGGQILTTSLSSGRTGTISLNATDSVTLSGSDPNFAQRQMSSTPLPLINPYAASGIYAQTQGAGDVGNLRIETDRLTVRDGAAISVNSTGSGKAAQLQVKARFIELDNQGSITATTNSGNGGDVDLQVQNLLLMRRGSEISTTAGTAQQGGDGGNITINAPNGFIVAAPNENSDITANAYTGKGGRVDIKAFGIFGIQPRQSPTSQSDITASSRFGVNGTVQINTPDIDPNQGLINLPVEPVEPKVASGCTAGASQNQSRFVVTGRGGLPVNPREAFNNNDTVRVDWVALNTDSDNQSQTVTKPTIPTPAPIVEATGLAINAKGEVLLTAEPPTATLHSSWQTPTTCGAPKSAREQ